MLHTLAKITFALVKRTVRLLPANYSFNDFNPSVIFPQQTTEAKAQNSSPSGNTEEPYKSETTCLSMQRIVCIGVWEDIVRGNRSLALKIFPVRNIPTDFQKCYKITCFVLLFLFI